MFMAKGGTPVANAKAQETAVSADEDEDEGISSSAARHWPRTFTERGVSVPFTTPVLAQARMRKRSKDEEAELLVSGLSGAKGIYVIGWRSVREIFTRMTTHDQRLYAALATRNRIVPEGVRKISLKISNSGLAGPQAAATAKASLEEMENEKLLANYHLVSTVLKSHSKDKKGITVADLATAKGRQKVKDRLSEIGSRFSLSADEFYSNLEEWSDTMAAMGLPDVPMKTRYRRMRDNLREFATSILEWARNDRSESAQGAKLVGQVAEATLILLDLEFENVDKMAQELGPTMQNWKANKVALAQAVERVSWMLDGWDPVVAMWSEHKDLPRHEQQAMADEVCRVMPVVPEEEIKKSERVKWRDMTNGIKNTVQALEDWSTGEIDVVMVMRIEKMKAKAR